MIKQQTKPAHRFAIEELIHHWFAFFEGDTVSAVQQSALFTEDAQIIHAGQYLLANGVKQVESWLSSVPPETSSHTLEGLTLEPLAQNTYKAQWQTAYQSVRAQNSVGGSVISYQALIDIQAQGDAKFRVVQKTPIANNPNQTFQESFATHRLEALCCRLAALALAFNEASFSELNIDKDCSDKLRTLLQHSKLTISTDAQQLILHAGDTRYTLSTIESQGRFPMIQHLHTN